MENWVIFIVVLGLVIVAVYFVPRYLVKKAISQVIHIFRIHHAINARNAKTAGELGLGSPTILQRLMRTRDYKPDALSILLRNEIVQTVGDDKLYLSEDRLASSMFAQAVSRFTE